MPDFLRPSPWDTAAFGVSCFELDGACEEALAYAASTPGHYTVKLDPLADKSLLDRYGFYYTDTLLEPVCDASRFIDHMHAEASVDTAPDVQMLLPMCRNSFVHGRFHRDFNLSPDAADQRYMRWLEQLQREDTVLGLGFSGELAGFIAERQGVLVLHALDERFRGKGLAKYLWSAACRHLFAQGAGELSSSISASNLAVLNLYASLGFRFRHAVDIYHRLSV